MMENKISVIVPVYNSEKYISDCVNSILTQSLSPTEIILINDGSTDNSAAICDDLAKKHNNILVIHKENGGAATARNYGLDKATGDYIMFVDSDDLLHPQALEFLLKMMQSKNADISMCYYTFFNDMPESFNHISIDYAINNSLILKGQELLEDFTEHCGRVRLISLCMKLFKKEIFKEIRIPEGYIEEDSLVLPYILEQAQIIAQSDLELYYWRITPGSVTRSGFNEKSFAYIRVSYENEKFFSKRKNRKVALFYRKQFMKRCLSFYYNIPNDRKDLLNAYKPYRKLYIRNFLKFWLTVRLSPRERLVYLFFLLNPNIAKKLFYQLYGGELL